MQACSGYVTGTVQDLYVWNNEIYVEDILTIVGGIVGVGDGCILRCATSGNITAKSCTVGGRATSVGGIVGNVSAQGKNPLIESCYSEANLSASSDVPVEDGHKWCNVNVGGIAGGLQCKKATVSNCYNRGAVSGRTLQTVAIRWHSAEEYLVGRN